MKRISLFVCVLIAALNIGCLSGPEIPVPDYSKWEPKEIFSVEVLCHKNFLMFRTAFRNAQHDEIVQVTLRPVLIIGNKVTEGKKESARRENEWWLMVARKREGDSWQASTYKNKRILFVSIWSLIDNRMIERAEDYSDYVASMRSLAEKELCSNDLMISFLH